MQVERVFIGVHVVEAHELESMGFYHLVAEDVHAIVLHQSERAFRIDILLVIPSHVVDGRRESSQRLKLSRQERRLGVDEVTCNQNDVRLTLISFFNDLLEVLPPRWWPMWMSESCIAMTSRLRPGSAVSVSNRTISPHAAGERHAGRQEQCRRTDAGFRYVPRPLDDMQECKRERQEDVASKQISAKDLRQAGYHISGLRRGPHQHERANECRHNEHTQQPPPLKPERSP